MNLKKDTDMDKKEYLKLCKVYRGEEEFPYSRNSKEDEYKYVLWLNERAAIRECITDNIKDYIKIIETINRFVKNGLSMYHDDWAKGSSMSTKTLEKIHEYDAMPFLG